VRYLGGKSRIAGRLAVIVNEARKAPSPINALFGDAESAFGLRPFWDPFCGGLSVSVALGGRGLVSDVNQALIELYRAVAAGWDPPSALTREEWGAARSLPDTNPLKAFAGFSCSFGGIYFNSYTSQDGPWTIRSGPGAGRVVRRSHAAAAARATLLRDVPALVARGCVFAGLDFLEVEPEPTDAVLYLDPPYKGVTGYRGVAPFDHAHFYTRVRQWSAFTDVFVSEYALPLSVGALLVWEAPATTRGLTQGKRPDRPREKLYWLGPGECPVKAWVSA
jgi:DNA adenine methylase